MVVPNLVLRPKDRYPVRIHGGQVDVMQHHQDADPTPAEVTGD